MLQEPWSDSPSVLLCGALLLLLSAACWLSTPRRPSRLPPGPGPSLPVLGHLHLVGSDPRATFVAWRRRYGDVFSLYLGGRLVVVLGGLPAIKEALVKMADVFSHRPRTFITDRLTQGTGIANSSGAIWKEQRKTTLEILRELGMGKNVLAEKIQEEIIYYIRAIEGHQGAPVDLATLTQNTVSNNICSIVFGQRYECDDSHLTRYVNAFSESLRVLSPGALINYIPFLEHIPGDLFKVKRVLRNTEMLQSFVNQHVDLHHRQRAQGTANTDYIHAYLSHCHQQRGLSADTTLNDLNLRRSIIDLFGAGTDTTSNAILWALLLFLHYPEVQENCFKEISDVIGTARHPTMADKASLVYVEATMMEVLRRADIAPNAIAHGLADDVTFRGYVIPKDAIVIPFLDSVLNDPEIWGDPDHFRPDRFIGPDGKLKSREEFIPFGIGRRMCPGASLARMELFLYLSNLVQRFRFLSPEGEQPPSLEGIMGFIHSPAPFRVLAVRRN